MEYLGLNEIREKFLTFFESKQHLRMKSFSLVPDNDKSLLLINSGMAPLKPYFTGQKVPPNKRVTTCQKCIRTGDIENVGITARHGTFFEMLGNFSFGDYFKEEVIPWAWEFVTEVLKLPKERLYVSVYQDDDEAYDIWNKKIGLDPSKIFRMGKEDNFWEVGLGPCGPCSEIYYDKGEEFGCGSPNCTVGCECDRYMEFWNLVFTQFSKEEDGSYSNLAHPNIDTGMGLERMATIMQNINSIFDIDTMKAIRDKVCSISGKTYEQNHKDDISIRIITDHIRSVTFMASDGVLPSNEGRGYVLKRLIRRAVRHGKLIGIDRPFMTEVCEVVIENSCHEYSELLEKKEYILKILAVEEEKFRQTLNQGMELLKSLIESRKGTSNVILGQDAFKLYDTFGFPIELMKEILKEENMDVDEAEFNREMEIQKERAREVQKGEGSFMGAEETIYNKIDPALKSEFIGYESLNSDNLNIIALISNNEIVDEVSEGEEIAIILDKTSFYAESGGQKGDIGIIESHTGSILVRDTIKVAGDKISHIGIIKSGKINSKQKVTTKVDFENRLSTARNHTSTHLLHKALKEVLGNHVEQAGSYVTNKALRFDFTHIEALTQEQIKSVEDIVNNKIFACLPVVISEQNIDDARKMGATALFGEKYGEVVRVVKIGDFSIEFCGGTHLTNTSQASTFKILSENGISSGVRRIEALTGRGALEYYNNIESKVKTVASVLKASPENIMRRIEFFVSETKFLNNEVEKLKSKLIGDSIDELIKSADEINGLKILVSNLPNNDIESLRKIGDKLKDKIKNGVIVLFGTKDDKISVISMATDEAVKKGIHSGKIIKEATAVIDGSGGGKPNMAQGGGKDISKIKTAIEKSKEIINSQLS